MPTRTTTLAVANRLSADHMLRWAQIGSLAACTLVLGFIESFVAIPIPGLRLGLANICVLITLRLLGPRDASLVALIKVLASVLLWGSPLSLVFSLLGTAFSLVAMIPLAQISQLHIVFVSIAGALMHELGQLLAAQLVLGSAAVWQSAPLLLLGACITGCICGILANKGLASAANQEPLFQTDQETLRSIEQHLVSYEESSTADVSRRVGVSALGFLGVSLLVLFLQAPLPLLCCVAAAFVALLVVQAPLKQLAHTLFPMLLILVVSFVVQGFFQPQGEVLLSLGRFAVTLPMLGTLCAMAARLWVVSCVSVIFVVLVSRDDMLAALREGAKRLARTTSVFDGPVLAFEVALLSLPVFVSDLSGQLDSNNKSSLAQLTELIVDVVSNAFGLVPLTELQKEKQA